MDLKRVNRIQQKPRDCVHGYVKAAQLLLPANSAYFHIVDLIKHLILLFYYSALESEILDNEDQDKFFKLLKDDDKSIANMECEWNLIFDSNKDGFKRDTFVSKVHGEPNVVIIIELKKECIIGGYTKKGWDSSINEYKWITDNDAFVFYLASKSKQEPFILNVAEENGDASKAVVGHDEGYYGMLGWTWIFFFDDGEFNQQDIEPDDYETFENFPMAHGTTITGDESYNGTPARHVVIEVFQIKCSSK